MINDLKQTNDDLKKFNYAYMGANNKLLQIQNQKLLSQIDRQNNLIKDLKKEIKELRHILSEHEKDMNIHKLV